MNPLNTLAGRLVLVTIAAIFASYAIVSVLLWNERGTTLRRVSEGFFAERVAERTERLRRASAEERANYAVPMRDFGVRYRVIAAPSLPPTSEPQARRIAQRISGALGGGEARVAILPGPSPEFGPPPWGAGMEERHGRRGPPRLGVLVEVRLDDTAWLEARARLPAPAPAPRGLFGMIAGSIVLVGLGALLVSRQISRPLAELADAARRLGGGDARVAVRVRGPADVRRAGEAFNAMAERLSRQIERQRRMLWALSHDLKTPITAMRLRAELLNDDAAKEKLLANLAEMEALTEQALALARAGAGLEAPTRVDLADIATTLAAELSDLGLRITAETGEPVFVVCRPAETARALRNLAENAHRHGGGGVIRVQRRSNGAASADVIDSGPGVPATEIEKLTAPFYRHDPARSSHDRSGHADSGVEGSGLGLAIAQAIADAQGAQLELQNRPEGGFRASLVFPPDGAGR